MIGPALFVLAAYACTVVVFAPETEVGKALRRALVVAPARLLNGGPVRIFVAVVVFVGLVALAVGAPEMVALFGMADLSLYLDIVVLSFMVGAVTRLRTVGQSVMMATRRVVGGRRSNRAHLCQKRARTPRAGKPRRPMSDDDGPSRTWALA